jgi:hypothetical protein
MEPAGKRLAVHRVNAAERLADHGQAANAFAVGTVRPMGLFQFEKAITDSPIGKKICH